MLVSASFLSSKDIPKFLTKLNDTDINYIHVDVMDGVYVKNKTMPFREMRHISDYTSKRLDVHLMVKNPLKYIPDYASLNTEYITIHKDIEDDLLTCLKEIKSYYIKTGIALKAEDEIKDIIPYLPYIDLILIMSVTPGAGGQSFQEEAVSKMKEAQILKKEYSKDFSFIVSVDGGINADTITKVNNYVDMVVSGSYLSSSTDLQEAIDTLR
ncbi:MAG: ribulose-phosphate 3-epimerase [bacterium]|nr:ribulose-phosphate 3-epimerase [bacterium]